MLNIQKIFEAQDKLDCKVVEVHGLQGLNLTGDVTQAFYTELGELSNEIGFFKYWKKNIKDNKARQYDEWADCLHFIASLGNKYGHSNELTNLPRLLIKKTAEKTYHYSFDQLYHNDLSNYVEYVQGVSALVSIGLKLGMTCEDMEKAYFEKNQVNYDRLASGY